MSMQTRNWPKSEEAIKAATVVELNAFAENETPNVYFSEEEHDLRKIQEA